MQRRSLKRITRDPSLNKALYHTEADARGSTGQATDIFADFANNIITDHE